MRLKANIHKHKSVWITLLLAIMGTVLYFQVINRGEADSAQAAENILEWQSLVEEKESIHLRWLRTLNPYIKKTEGDLVWNTALQKGVMRFVNLPKLNDERYYHLWIYDLHQSQEKPVLAGVFQFVGQQGQKRSNSEFYVPIVPEQIVKQPFKFLLTIGKKNEKTFLRSQSLLLAQP